MVYVTRIWRGSMYLLLSVFLFSSCNTHAKRETSDINTDSDTVRHTSKVVTATSKKGMYAVDTVLINDMKFVPEVVRIHKGDTVIWINNDMVAHCITETKTKAWTSFQLSAGDIWKAPVDKSADYYCAIHQVMKGKVVVE